MKKFLFVVLTILVLTFTLTSPSFAKDDYDLWPSKDGMLCWGVEYKGETLGYVEMAIREVAGKYYVVAGKNIEIEVDEVTKDELIYDIQWFDGSAEVIADIDDYRIVINVSSAGYRPDDRHAALGTLELDKNLGGTLRVLEIWALDHDNYDWSGPIPRRDFSVQPATDKVLTVVPCDRLPTEWVKE